MNKYKKGNDNDVTQIDIEEKYIKFACCDCGLVHTFDISIVDKKPHTISFAAKRERRATAQLRRYKFGYLQKPVKGDKYKMVRTRS